MRSVTAGSRGGRPAGRRADEVERRRGAAAPRARGPRPPTGTVKGLSRPSDRRTACQPTDPRSSPSGRPISTASSGPGHGLPRHHPPDLRRRCSPSDLDDRQLGRRRRTDATRPRWRHAASGQQRHRDRQRHREHTQPVQRLHGPRTGPARRRTVSGNALAEPPIRGLDDRHRRRTRTRSTCGTPLSGSSSATSGDTQRRGRRDPARSAMPATAPMPVTVTSSGSPSRMSDVSGNSISHLRPEVASASLAPSTTSSTARWGSSLADGRLPARRRTGGRR